MKKELIFIVVFILLPVFASAELVEVEVRYGDTLSIFADKYLKDISAWPKIYELNKNTIKDPNKIYPGQIIKIPVELLKEEVGDLTKLLREVKIKKREGTDWQRGTIDERLFPEDGIMTGRRASARVDFLVGSNLKIYENSLIYLKPTVKKTAVASLLGGGINVRDAKIITPSAQVIPQAGSEYDVNVDDDKTTKVSVRSGEVNVKAKGKTVRVIKGFRTLVKLNEAPQSPEALPLDGEEALKFRDDFADNVNINFRLQVSQANDFKDLIKNERISEIDEDNIKKDLQPGRYYWRAAVIDNEGFKGKFSDAREIVVRTRSGSSVDLTGFEIINKEEGIMRIKGFAKNTARVSVNGFPASIAQDGRFTTTIILPSSQNIITVIATGEEGMIMRKYSRTDDGIWLPTR